MSPLSAVFNLSEATHVKEMEAKILAYKQENAESIARNEAKKVQRCHAVTYGGSSLCTYSFQPL